MYLIILSYITVFFAQKHWSHTRTHTHFYMERKNATIGVWVPIGTVGVGPSDSVFNWVMFEDGYWGLG